MINFKKQYRWLPVISAAVILLLLTHFYISLFTPPGESTEPVIVEFQPGVSFYKISKDLEEKGLIRDRGAFTLLARLRGSTKEIKAGEYEFNQAMTPMKILYMLEEGLVIKHPVTIPEGFSIADIADLLEKKGLSRKDMFIKTTSDKAFLSALGIDAGSAEGYLFPDTYLFTKGMTEEAMIRNMVSRFREVFTDELKMRTGAIGLSAHEVVILASVVEKETGDAIERPRIARVFMNRLKRGIPLQSDPTVIYGIKDFNGNLMKKDLVTETPYNTYVKRGLPAGPIANPGEDSIKSVLYPEEGDYLYFVSKNNGTHHFSRTLSEHNRAVQQYQVKKQETKSTAETRRR